MSRQSPSRFSRLSLEPLVSRRQSLGGDTTKILFYVLPTRKYSSCLQQWVVPDLTPISLTLWLAAQLKRRSLCFHVLLHFTLFHSGWCSPYMNVSPQKADQWMRDWQSKIS